MQRYCITDITILCRDYDIEIAESYNFTTYLNTK